MTPERLKDLAEAAGLKTNPYGCSERTFDNFYMYPWNYPALLPLIAERLVARVKKRIDYGDSKLLTELAVGSAEDRAEAAYAVLEAHD